MTQVWNWTWLTVAFLAELGALAALAAWGWSAGGSTATAGRLLLAVAAAGGAAVLWGVFAAPQAPVQVAAVSIAVKVLVFGAGVLALVVTGHPRLALLLGAAAVLSSVLSTPPPS